jgi:hypothetical protein
MGSEKAASKIEPKKILVFMISVFMSVRLSQAIVFADFDEQIAYITCAQMCCMLFVNSSSRLSLGWAASGVIIRASFVGVV